MKGMYLSRVSMWTLGLTASGLQLVGAFGTGTATTPMDRVLRLIAAVCIVAACILGDRQMRSRRDQ